MKRLKKNDTTIAAARSVMGSHKGKDTAWPIRMPMIMLAAILTKGYNCIFWISCMMGRDE